MGYIKGIITNNKVAFPKIITLILSLLHYIKYYINKYYINSNLVVVMLIMLK